MRKRAEKDRTLRRGARGGALPVSLPRRILRLVVLTALTLLLLLLERTVLYLTVPVRAGADLCVGMLLYITYTRGERAGGIYGLATGLVSGLLGYGKIILQPLLYLLLVYLTAALAARLLRRNLACYALLLTVGVALRCVADLLPALLYPQNGAVAPLLLTLACSFALTLTAAVPISLAGRLLLGRGMLSARESSAVFAEERTF